jgi:hypothetical protein
MGSDMQNTSANTQAEVAQAPKSGIESDSTGPVECVVVDVAKVNLRISKKWRRRLRELDDYQRSAPFVLGRFTLG